MTSTAYPALYSVRNQDDFSVLEDDVFDRYNVPDNWLILEVLGLSSVAELINAPDESTIPKAPVLPKRPSFIDDVVVESVPLFLRL